MKINSVQRLGFLLSIPLIVCGLFFYSCKKNNNATPETPSTPAPTIASNNSPVGIGDTIYLKAATVAGATYTWTGPGITSFNQHLQNPSFPYVYNALTPIQTYAVVVTVNGVNSAPYYTYVTNMEITATSDSLINPSPVAPKVANTFISGNTVTLAASSVLNMNNQPVSYVNNSNQTINVVYSWNGPNNFTSSLQYPTFKATMLTAGTYSVSATYGAHKSQVKTVKITVRPAAPTIAITGSSPIVGGTLQLSATIPAGALGTDSVQYLWSGPNNFSYSGVGYKYSSINIPNVSRAATGIYTLNTVSNGVTSVGANLYVNVNFSQSGCGSLSYVVVNSTKIPVVTIGNQCWMTSNLTFNNSTLLTWANMNTASSSPAIPMQGACPTGWHLPTDSMLQSLASTVGSNGNALKTLASGYGSGVGPNTSGFSANPLLSASVADSNNVGIFWSATGVDTLAQCMKLISNSSVITFQLANKQNSYYVRCLKD